MVERRNVGRWLGRAQVFGQDAIERVACRDVLGGDPRRQMLQQRLERVGRRANVEQLARGTHP